MNNRTYVKASLMYFVGNIFDKAVAFITIPIFTRLLTTNDYGITTTYLSWISMLAVIITLSLGNSIRTAVVDYKESTDEYVSSIFTLGTISALIITGLIVAISLIINIGIPIKLILLCCIHAYSSSVLSTIQWRYMMEVKYVKRTILQCLPNLLVVIVSIILINNMQSDRYYGRIYSYALINVSFALCYLVYYFFKGRTGYNPRYWKYALSFSLPIIFHSISNVILSQADRTMITWLRNASETGIYGVAYQFGMVPLVFTTTFENIWIPWFTKKMEGNDKKSINNLCIPYIWSVCILCIGIMLVAPEVLKFMTTKDYYSAAYYISPVVTAMFLMFLASISVDLEYYLKRTKGIAINTLIAAVINIILNYLFIPVYGGVAAAYTTVASYAISFLMHYFIAKKLDNELFPFKIYIAPLLLTIVFMVLVNLIMSYPVIRWMIAVILGITFVLILYRIKKARE